jgi:hypothetical protein
MGAVSQIVEENIVLSEDGDRQVLMAICQKSHNGTSSGWCARPFLAVI